jgi:hypothetical protein
MPRKMKTELEHGLDVCRTTFVSSFELLNVVTRRKYQSVVTLLVSGDRTANSGFGSHVFGSDVTNKR